jgi:hypothetical protein
MSKRMSDSHYGGYSLPQIVDELLAGHEITWERLDAIRAGLAVEIFGGNGWTAPPEAAGDPRVTNVLDVFQAMELLDPNEPAFSWNRAGLLCDLGLYSEAALVFLEAARRLDVCIAAGLIKPDEAEWSQAARAYACQALVLAGRVTAAAVVWQALTDSDYRYDVNAKIKLALRDAAAAREPIEWIPHPPWQYLRD